MKKSAILTAKCLLTIGKTFFALTATESLNAKTSFILIKIDFFQFDFDLTSKLNDLAFQTLITMKQDLKYYV